MSAIKTNIKSIPANAAMPADFTLEEISPRILEELIKETQTEIRMRLKVYRRQVQLKKMSLRKANVRIARMRFIEKMLQLQLEAQTGQQGELFTEPK